MSENVVNVLMLEEVCGICISHQWEFYTGVYTYRHRMFETRRGAYADRISEGRCISINGRKTYHTHAGLEFVPLVL